MSKTEGQCRWHFDRQTGEDEGPGDALGQNFKGEPYAALVRESLQNSLDVPQSNGKPVKVKYSFGNIDSNLFPNFFKLKHHIEGCMDFWHAKRDIVAQYQRKLERFNNGFFEQMPYLKVSDSNTQGMPYEWGNNNLPFYAFVRASKISVKGDAYHGGTYGFGKAAYFQLSPINTLFISTMTEDGKVYFEGKSVLCTHTFGGEKKTSVGFYDNNNGEGPIEVLEDIPKQFRRSEPGTDFYILGFTTSNMEAAIQKMLEEVLRSFHPAIHAEMLEVEIVKPSGEVFAITQSTLPEYMAIHFNSLQDTSGQFRSLNPRPYYDALIHKGEGKGFDLIEGCKPHLGNVKMYIKKDPEATDKIVYMRRPHMVVFSKKSQSSLGFYGVFVCEDKNGDELLSKLENSSHSQWSSSYYRDDITSDPIPEGLAAMKELQEYREECIAKIAGENSSNELSISGLEDLLYVPASLIEDYERQLPKPIGTPVGTQYEENGSIISTADSIFQENLRRKTDEYIGTILVDTSGTGKNIDKGKELIGTGHTGEHRSGGSEIPPGDEIHTADIDEGKGNHFVLMNVPVRVFAQESDGTIYHIIVIHSNRNVENGKMELVVCGEQYDMQIDIVDADNGIANSNTITNMKFGAEIVRIKVRFADNMKHSVQTKLYYEE